MKKQNSLVAAISVVALVASLISPGIAVAVPGEVRVTDSTASQVGPAVSGDVVVWRDARNGNWDIFAYDFAAGEEIEVCTDPSIQMNPSVSGSRVVWQDFRNGNWDIYAYDLSTGIESAIDLSPRTQQNPVVAGDLVVWEDFRNGNWDVFYWDFEIEGWGQVTYEPTHERDPDTDGRFVVWEDNRDGDWDIYSYDFDNYSERALTGTVWNEGQPSVSGDSVAWADYRYGNWDIVVGSLSTGETQRLTTHAATQMSPQVGGELVVWQDYRNGNWDVYLFDRVAGTEKNLTGNPSSQVSPQTDGIGVAWEDARNGNNDIYYLPGVEGSGGIVPLGDDFSPVDLGPVVRISGVDRYATAGAIVGSAWTGEADTVVIATGEGYADALSASGLAGYLDAPLMLTRPNSLSPDLVRRITALGADKAIIVGGPSAVGPAVESALEGLGLEVSRVAGRDRYATSRAVAQRMKSESGGSHFVYSFLVRGDAFADALAVAPFAYNAGIPVLLTRPDVMPRDTELAIEALDTCCVVIVGGPASVSVEIEDSLGGMLERRVAGANRYETAVRIAEYATEMNWGGWHHVGIATGGNFPDALSGGAVAGWFGGVLLMTDSGQLSPSVQAALKAHAGDVTQIQVFGGTNAVSSKVFGQVEAALR